MEHLAAMGFLAALLSWGSFAHADADACTSASSRGQIQRHAHRWLEAREQFLTCARQDCPNGVRKDCAAWLEEAQGNVPTIVPLATDEAGNGAADVRVLMDGHVLLAKADGRAVEVNPGSYRFTFIAPNGARTERQVVVAEGEKGKSIVATLPTPGMTRETSSLGALKTIGIGAAGAGVLGMALGSVFGLEASSKKHSAECNARSVCPNQNALNTLDAAQNDGNLSTTVFVIGGLLAAGGITMWALAPGRGVQVTASASANAAGVLMRGTW